MAWEQQKGSQVWSGQGKGNNGRAWGQSWSSWWRDPNEGTGSGSYSWWCDPIEGRAMAEAIDEAGHVACFYQHARVSAIEEHGLLFAACSFLEDAVLAGVLPTIQEDRNAVFPAVQLTKSTPTPCIHSECPGEHQGGMILVAGGEGMCTGICIQRFLSPDAV